MKKDKKNKNSKNNIVDLTSYINADMVNADVNGSYTGIPADMFYNGELDEAPIQDADDL